MNKTIIFDFTGIIADFNIAKLALDAPLKEKFSMLRIVASLKKFKAIKSAFNKYQTGLIDRDEFKDVVASFYPNSAYVIPRLLDRLPSYVHVNQQVLDLAKELKEQGYQLLIMSNSIPETELVIKDLDLSMFDGVMLSCQMGIKKPSPEIFQYAIETYDLDPSSTLFIDDSDKNLKAAEKLGIQPIRCKNTEQVCETLKLLLSISDLDITK